MDLFQNPFHILNASSRDNRQKIIELYEERSLTINPNECIHARSDLMNPRKRLSAEIAWLPGLGQKRTVEVLSLLQGSMSNMLKIGRLTPIARTNLIATALIHLPASTPEDMVDWIHELAIAFDIIDPAKLCAVINEDRIVSGFPEVKDLSMVDAEIQERRYHYLKAIKAALDNLSAKEQVDAVTFIVDSGTDHGEKHGPVLIDDLVDSYEVDKKAFLDDKTQTIETQINKINIAAETKKTDLILSQMVDQLIQEVKNWDAIAQPIQVNKKSRGLDHEASQRVASLVRSLAVNLFNEHGKLKFSQQLTNMLQEAFTEVIDIAERTAEDVSALDDIAKHQKLNSIMEICRSAFESSEKQPSSADKEAERINDAFPPLLSEMIKANLPDDIVSKGKDEVSLTMMHCAVVFGNSTKRWLKCITILENALGYASSQEVKDRVINNLDIVRNNERLYGDLAPISSAPSISSINGIGFKLYGSTDFDKGTESYLSTYYFIVFFIPIFPICRYRVIPTDGGYRFLGKSPLRTFDKWHLFIILSLIAILFLRIISKDNTVHHYPSSAPITTPQYAPTPGRVSTPQRYSTPQNYTAPQSNYYNSRATEANNLAQKIENDKSRAKQIEIEIQTIDSQIDAQRRQLESYRLLDMIDEYNMNVPRYNSLITDRSILYDRYKRLIDKINADVVLYNSTYR